MTMWDFANNHPFEAMIMALCAAYAITWFPWSIVLIFRRYFRHKNIAIHGYPPGPYVDADGDIVESDCKCTEDRK